jgi:pilus assembly protein Flp/PilA
MLLALYTRVHSLMAGFRGRFENEDGAVATEYALLLTLIALAIVLAATALGTAIAGKFSSACTQLGGSGCGP